MNHPAWPALIDNCFQSTEFMALGTNGPEGMWVNPVYFAWGEKYALHFISQLDCRHMHNIKANPAVSCAIYPTNQSGDVFGAYVSGQARLLTEGPELTLAKKIYYSRVHGEDQQAINHDSYSNDPAWHHVRIDLTGLWYFDTRYFEETRTPVPDQFWK